MQNPIPRPKSGDDGRASVKSVDNGRPALARAEQARAAYRKRRTAIPSADSAANAAPNWKVAAADGPLLLALGVALWGAHMGLTQGLLSKLVADSAPATLRGTAFGLFNLASGVALLFASVIAGALWEAFGAAATFQLGAAFAALSALGIAVLRLR